MACPHKRREQREDHAVAEMWARLGRCGSVPAPRSQMGRGRPQSGDALRRVPPIRSATMRAGGVWASEPGAPSVMRLPKTCGLYARSIQAAGFWETRMGKGTDPGTLAAARDDGSRPVGRSASRGRAMPQGGPQGLWLLLHVDAQLLQGDVLRYGEQKIEALLDVLCGEAGLRVKGNAPHDLDVRLEVIP